MSGYFVRIRDHLLVFIHICGAEVYDYVYDEHDVYNEVDQVESVRKTDLFLGIVVLKNQ